MGDGGAFNVVAAPVTSAEPDDQLPGHSVQIQIDEAEAPAARPQHTREEPTPPTGGSPPRVPEPKESGPASPEDGENGRPLDVDVYRGQSDADDDLYGSGQRNNYDADDGDDEEDDQVGEARHTGTYPATSGQG